MNTLFKFVIFLAVAWLFNSAFAAEITKGNKRAVIIVFDPFDENFVVGDKLYASEEGVHVGVLEITKIKGPKALARILEGRANPGMGLEKYDVVATVKTKEVEAASQSVTMQVGSIYVWRGLVKSRPFISGAINYADTDVLAGVTISNADSPAESEVDFNLGHSFTALNGSITPMLWFYSYPGHGSLDTFDFTLNLSYRVIALDFSYIPRYFGVNTSDFYSRISTSAGLGQRWKIYGHAGLSIFSKERPLQHKSYLDLKGAIIYSTNEFTAEFGWTDTLRRDFASNELKKDAAAAILFSKTF